MEMGPPFSDEGDSFAFLLCARFFSCLLYLIPFLELFFFVRLISLMNNEPRENPPQA